MKISFSPYCLPYLAFTDLKLFFSIVCPGEPLVRVVGQQEVPSVPEPSTVISLLALGGLSLGLKGKCSKKQ